VADSLLKTLARGLSAPRASAPSGSRAAVLRWAGFGLLDVEQMRDWYGGTSHSGQRVTPDQAMRLSAVYSCVRLISQAISTMPIMLYRATAEGRERVTKHAAVRLVRQKPNARTTASPFWESVVASILLRRGAFIEKVMLGDRPVSLEFLRPDRITAPEGKPYRYLERDGRYREIPRDRVIYIPAFTVDGEFGLSVIEYGLEVMGLALAADRAAGSTFEKGMLPTVAFSYPGTMRSDQRDDARKTIQTLSGAVNAGKPVILEAGTTAIPLGIDPSDAQLLESRQLSAEEICSLFGVPPTMIGRGDKSSSWASSSENLALWFLQYTLAPWLKRIELALWDGLLTAAEQSDHYFEHAVEGILRADAKSRAELYASALQNGWMSRNEVRRLENQTRIDGGDAYTVQSNLVMLDRVGSVPPVPAPQARSDVGRTGE
jgi:HK97 family phage portal protein